MRSECRNPLEKYGISLYMIRVTLSATLSWVAVHLLYGDGYLYFAPLAAILITQGSVKASFEKGVYRLIGILLGGTVSLVIGQFFDVGALSILLMLIIGIGIATACRINIQAISQVGVTSVLALTFYHDHYVWWRLAETFTGVAIALVINMIIVSPKALVKAKERALEAGLLLADSLMEQGVQASVQPNNSSLTRASASLADSRQSLKELRFTMAHLNCRGEFDELTNETSHLKEMLSLIEQIRTELGRLPGDCRTAEWLRPVAESTADCIAVFVTRRLSGAECRQQLPEALRQARQLQLEAFSELRSACSLAALREVGSLFSRLNLLLEEVERAELDAASLSSRPAARYGSPVWRVRFGASKPVRTRA
ncbi:aromatic acid exporter family protein [Paenibacillus sp. CN-4]|uniref:FUSC family protein n=1 Tax=Paenibacillus nanchangensis TaxID=3348343 RepID=UPI00397B5BDD